MATEQRYRLLICGILLLYILALVAGAIYQYAHRYELDPPEPPDDCDY